MLIKSENSSGKKAYILLSEIKSNWTVTKNCICLFLALRFHQLSSSYQKVYSKHTCRGALSKPVPKDMHPLGVVTGLCMCCPKREPKLLRRYHQHLLTCIENNTKCLF